MTDGIKGFKPPPSTPPRSTEAPTRRVEKQFSDPYQDEAILVGLDSVDTELRAAAVEVTRLALSEPAPPKPRAPESTEAAPPEDSEPEENRPEVPPPAASPAPAAPSAAPAFGAEPPVGVEPGLRAEGPPRSEAPPIRDPDRATETARDVAAKIRSNPTEAMQFNVQANVVRALFT